MVGLSKRVLLRTLERERIAYADERKLLLDTICRLSGHGRILEPPARPVHVEDDPDADLVADVDQHPE